MLNAVPPYTGHRPSPVGRSRTLAVIRRMELSHRAEVPPRRPFIQARVPCVAERRRPLIPRSGAAGVMHHMAASPDQSTPGYCLGCPSPSRNSASLANGPARLDSDRELDGDRRVTRRTSIAGGLEIPKRFAFSRVTTLSVALPRGGALAILCYQRRSAENAGRSSPNGRGHAEELPVAPGEHAVVVDVPNRRVRGRAPRAVRRRVPRRGRSPLEDWAGGQVVQLVDLRCASSGRLASGPSSPVRREPELRLLDHDLFPGWIAQKAVEAGGVAEEHLGEEEGHVGRPELPRGLDDRRLLRRGDEVV